MALILLPNQAKPTSQFHQMRVRASSRWINLGCLGQFSVIIVSASFKITIVEGIEVVFIVIAMGGGGRGLLLPASVGALAALLLVALLGSERA